MRKRMPLGRAMRKAAVRRKMAVLSAFVLTLALIGGSAFAASNLAGEAHVSGSAAIDFDPTQTGLGLDLDGCFCDCARFWPGEHHVYFVPMHPVVIDEHGVPSQSYRAVSGRFAATMWLDVIGYQDADTARLWLQVADIDAVSTFVPLNQGFVVTFYINGFVYEVTVLGVTQGVLITGGSIVAVVIPAFCEMFCQSCPLMQQGQDLTPIPMPIPEPMPEPELEPELEPEPEPKPEPDDESEPELEFEPVPELDDEHAHPEKPIEPDEESPPVPEGEYEYGYNYEYEYDYNYDYDYDYDYEYDDEYELDYEYDYLL